MSRRSISFWFILLPDALLLFVALWLSIGLRYGFQAVPENFGRYFGAFVWLYALWLLIFFIHGLFEISSFRRYTGIIFGLVSSMVVNLLLSITYFYLQPDLILTPRRFLLINITVAFGIILLWHLWVKYAVKNQLKEDVYLFSFNNELKELEEAIAQHPYMGYRVIGHLNEQSLEQAEFNKTAAIILPENVRANAMVLKKFYELRTSGMRFYNTSDFYENLLRRVYLSELSEVWFLENINYQEKKFYNLVKRGVDLLLGFVAFVIFVVTYPVIAVLIKLDSKGSVLFTQSRVGKNGQVFTIYKYRSMAGGRTDTWTEKNDPRITRLGNILRKTRLDELPQSINLLKGDLSLVGPRPEQVHIVEQLRKDIPFYDERHLVKPGLTGWAQLNIYAGSLEETKLKLQYDLYYIKNRSFLFDLEIILKTAYYIFTWQGR